MVVLLLGAAIPKRFRYRPFGTDMNLRSVLYRIGTFHLDEIHDQIRKSFDDVPGLLRAELRVMSGDIGWFWSCLATCFSRFPHVDSLLLDFRCGSGKAGLGIATGYGWGGQGFRLSTEAPFFMKSVRVAEKWLAGFSHPPLSCSRRRNPLFLRHPDRLLLYVVSPASEEWRVVLAPRLNVHSVCADRRRS